MSRTVIFDSPYLLGFDDMRDLIERIGRSHDTYPPYNVEALSPDHLRISIAVAGFTADQLKVEVRQRAHLVITASKERTEAEGRDYLHRGLALRGFTRAFVLVDGLEVAKATLSFGLLHVDLTRSPAGDDVQVVPIDVA